jgi:hypothetical protein
MLNLMVHHVTSRVYKVNQTRVLVELTAFIHLEI